MCLMEIAVLLVCVLAAIWATWRLCSKKALLPCPAEFAWLVEKENPLALATRSERVVRQMALRPGARVMDIGCGPGRVTIPLARAVGSEGEVIALDVQGEMLAKVAEKMRREGVTNVRLVQSDVRRERIQDGSLDGAVLVMVLGEIPEEACVFSVVFSALKPGGQLLVAESVLDPHFVRRRKVRAKAEAAGFAERGRAGNIFGYSLVFEKPKAAN